MRLSVLLLAAAALALVACDKSAPAEAGAKPAEVAKAADKAKPAADEAKPAADEAAPAKQDEHAGHDHAAHDHKGHDHAEGAECSDPAGKAAPVERHETAKGEAVKLDGTSFGAGITLAETVQVSELLANVDKYEGKHVRVEGLVTGVCPKRGCWFDMAGGNDGSSVRFKVQDGVMVFPMDQKGRYAVAQGVVRKIALTLEQSKQWAKHQKAEYGADLDPEQVTEALTLIRLDGTGAVIRDKK